MKKGLNGNQKNIVCGVVTCVAAAFMFYYSRTHIKVNAFITGYGTDARTVPSIIYAFMFIMGVCLILTAVSREKRQFANTKEFKWIPAENLKPMGIVIITIVLYTLLVRKIGFFVMSAIYMMFLFCYTKVNVKLAIAISVGVEIALYLIFVVALNVPITRNVWLI